MESIFLKGLLALTFLSVVGALYHGSLHRSHTGSRDRPVLVGQPTQILTYWQHEIGCEWATRSIGFHPHWVLKQNGLARSLSLY